MDSFSFCIRPQYVKQTEEKEIINGKECLLHEVQKRIKLDFEQLPTFTIITAPTGTGKSYAFPFPALNAKKQPKRIGHTGRVRGLIVLPTNALISELTASFQKTYPQLTIQQLTGPALDRYQVKGYKRWEKALEVVESSDLVITNPDIINYAMHGGYHKRAWSNKTGATRFSRLLSAFNYIVFDEYHLYNEPEIANILTLVKLREFFLKHEKVIKGQASGVRFLFVSATPEKGLKDILEKEGYDYEEIIEEIVDDPTQARPIHGTLTVEFVDSKEMRTVVRNKIPALREVLKKQKVLIILDRLREVQELAEELKTVFPTYTIYQSTGYVARNEDQKAKIEAAHLIIATNKAEVGVNYDVTYCIMQPGKYFQNFVQRFGRVSRGDLTGKVVISIDKKYAQLKRRFKEVSHLNYYDFLALMRQEIQGRKFYTERIPMYLGEYMWCIQNNIRRYQDYDIHRYLQRRMEEEGFFSQGKVYNRYKIFNKINQQIREMIKAVIRPEKIPKDRKELKKVYTKLERSAPRTWQWVQWWDAYLETFFAFRDGGKTVEIYDEKYKTTLDYSLDWILQHKVVKEKKILQEEPYERVRYIVGNLKEQDKDLQYTVSTIPNAGMQGNNYLSYEEVFKLEEAFEKAVGRISDKVKKDPTQTKQKELLKEVAKLASTFSRKRLHIEDITHQEIIL
ncbi:MAG: type I-D CRISPR-associated helicase Cas3' [Thermonemataceae bacterium]